MIRENVHISKRLKYIASFITKDILVDVGTDHGYVPIYLTQKNAINHAIAADINKGPLLKATQHITEYGFEDRIEACLSNGLDKVNVQAGCSILIAGMGGLLINEILNNNIEKAKIAGELVLSPHSEVFAVREYLMKNGYMIVDEGMVIDEEKYYTVIRAVYKGISSSYTDLELIYGPILIKTKNSVLRSYLKKEFDKYILIKRGITNIERISQIDEILNNIKEAQKKLEE